MSKNEYFIDDTCFLEDTANNYKSIDEINEEIAQELVNSGLYEGKSYDEVLEYVKKSM